MTLIIGILILYIAFSVGYSQQKVSKASSIVISLGIFGTFLGVSQALMGFDPSKDVQESILYFVDSLKLAFVTSVLGVGVSILLQWLVKVEDNDNNDLYYYQLSFLEKMHSLLDDIHTLAMPNSPSYIVPKHQLMILEKLDTLNDTLLYLGTQSAANSMSNGTATTTEIDYRALNQWANENLANSFEKLRRDISLLVSNLKNYPDELTTFTDVMKETLDGFKQYHSRLEELDERFLQQTEGVEVFTEALKALNQQVEPIRLTQQQLDSFMISMMDIVQNMDNRESVETLRYLREQYTKELRADMNGLERAIAKLSDIVNVSIIQKRDRYA